MEKNKKGYVNNSDKILKNMKRCLKCEYCYDDDAGLYCELKKCKYDYSIKTFLMNILKYLAVTILLLGICGVLTLGTLTLMTILNINLKNLLLGILTLIPVYLVIFLIQKFLNKRGR